MHRRLSRVLLICGASLVFAPAALQAATEKRVALVIGVSQYQYVPRLPNPAGDAREIARRLSAFGFEVDGLYEKSPNKVELDAAVRRLRQRALDADVALVYFAGHGIELNGTTYLLPADARLEDERDARSEALSLGDLLDELDSRRAGRLNLIILDACRENPFRARLQGSGRSISRGLGRPASTVSGTLIAYSTRENDIAADGNDAHSPYTSALLDVMDKEPGLEIGLLFRRVRAAVMARTDRRQQPWEYGSLSDKEFYLKSPAAAQQQVAMAPVNPPSAAAAKPPAIEKVTYAADVFFDFDKVVLKPEGAAKMDDLAAKIGNIALEVVIVVGHADGSEKFSEQRAWNRAESVKAYLVSKGIERNRIYTEPKGSRQPVADNATAEGRAKNRRAEIEVVGTRARP